MSVGAERAGIHGEGMGGLHWPASWKSHPLGALPPGRSWINLYCVLHKGELGFYKDSKGRDSGSTHGNEPLLNLHNATGEVASDYKKKKHVLKIK